jgi:hypothetical protein
VAALGEPHLAGDVVLNCDTTPSTASMSFSDTQVLSNSAGLRLGDGADTDFIFQRGLRFVQPTYGPWTERHTFQGAASVAVPPGRIGFVVARNPVARDTGEFVIQIGNTHFYLKDLSFDSPDASRQPEYTTTTQPMTPEQRKAECSSGGMRKVPAAFASIERRGTATGDALTGGRERTLMRGLGGNDVLRGGSGDDVLDGGRGDDRLYGGPGSDRFVDSGGRTVVHTGGAPRSRPDVVDVRDGKGDDTVVCGSRRSVVKADRRDRLRNCVRPARRG